MYITVRMGSWEKRGSEKVIGIIILKSLFFIGTESRSTRRKEREKKNMKKGRVAPVL